MDFIKQNRVAIATVVVIAAIIGVTWLNQHNNDTKKQEDAKTSQQKAADEKKMADKKAADEKQEKEAARDYSYAAKSGDSYTVLARRSIQAYAQANDMTLSKAQIIAAETMLAQKANWRMLDIDEKVTFGHNSLKQAADDASKLTKSQLSAWQAYVPYVQF